MSDFKDQGRFSSQHTRNLRPGNAQVFNSMRLGSIPPEEHKPEDGPAMGIMEFLNRNRNII